jgi:putative transcriptional regulator
MRDVRVILLVLCLISSAAPAGAAGPERTNELLKSGAFLVSTRHLRDPNFDQTVVFLLTYGIEGAFGLIVNRPTDIPLAKALPDVEGIEKMSRPIYFGGPVNANRILAFLRSDSPLEGARKVLDHVYVTGSLNILTAALRGRNPDQRIRIYAGYAGWASKQLDAEFSRGDWVIMDADPETIFSEDPSKIWPAFFGNQNKIQIDFPIPESVPSRGTIRSGRIAAGFPDRQK